jgi:hypothetical protein
MFQPCSNQIGFIITERKAAQITHQDLYFSKLLSRDLHSITS